jgi:hypothetical protein
MAVTTSNPSFMERGNTAAKKKNRPRTPFASRRGSGPGRTLGNVQLFRNDKDSIGYVPARPGADGETRKFSKKQALIVFVIGLGIVLFLNADGVGSLLGLGGGIVKLEFLDEMPDDMERDIRNSFKNAANMWNGALSNDLGSTPLEEIVEGCRFDLPERVNGIIIGVRIRNIDGPGGTLGSAGPCAIQDVDGIIRARAGIMTFDTSDVRALIEAGSFEAVAAHEMGHVLGIGTLWAANGLVNNRFRYMAENGISGYEGMGGDGSVPVEDIGGDGTAGAHWRERVFNDELMTGFVEGGGKPNPLSKLTLESMKDLGYKVNVNKADDYVIPSQRAEIRSFDEASRTGSNKIDLTNDVADETIEIVRRLRRRLDRALYS